MKKIFLYSSIGLFACSLTQQCYCTTASCGYSIAVVITGIFCFAFGGASLAWLANPLLLTSWILVNKNPTRSLVTSLLATSISLSFLLFREVIDDEAGHYAEITSYRSGYWLWVLSSATMLIGNVLFYFQTRRSKVFLSS